ncbi:hypothetical protein C4568_02965 [Candidatus Parcubacteria bacterium]|nr:MAG: hypothetical protein C4568_02965 [Candidatus Parcubacteria bacterium]
MRTVSQVVEEILQRSPFLTEAMYEGVANNAQIARRIKPDVEKRLMEEVSEGSIAMALHRLSKDIKRPLFGERFLKNMSDITVRSNLVEFACPASTELPHLLDVLSTSMHARKDTFFNFSRGVHESLIIVSKEFAHDVEKMLKKEKDVKKVEGLSAITLRLPEHSLNVPGLYYPILKALAMEGISFVEVMSVRTEFSIIFEEKDVDRAFSVLKRITS